jgi:Caspase domain
MQRIFINCFQKKLNYSVFGNGPIIGSKLEKEYGWIKILEAIGNFFLDAKPRQTLLFYFSGHGIPKDGDVYLGTPQMERKKPSIKGYSLSDLIERMMTSAVSKYIVCIIDACYSGAAKLPGSKSTKKDSNASMASANYDTLFVYSSCSG